LQPQANYNAKRIQLDFYSVIMSLIYLCLFPCGETWTQVHIHHQSRFTAFLRGRSLGCAFNASWRVFSTKRLWM